MTFLKKYGFGAVGFTYLVSCVTAQWVMLGPAAVLFDVCCVCNCLRVDTCTGSQKQKLAINGWSARLLAPYPLATVITPRCLPTHSLCCSSRLVPLPP